MIITQGNTQQFVKDDASAHWYQLLPDGTVKARHEAGLREARKELLFPSPTSIEKDIRANPALTRWIKNEIAKSFVNNHRQPEELDDVYAARVLKVADSSRDNAAIRGTAIHKAIEDGGTTDLEILPYFEKYMEWERENVDLIIGSEVKLADPKIGVAGTVDRVAQLRAYGTCILDFKTQKVKDGKAAFYDSFPRQLSFYAKAWQRKHGGDLPRIISVVIDSQTPSKPQHKLYTIEEQEDAYREFLCHLWLWCNSHAKGGYWPVGKWLPHFPN